MPPWHEILYPRDDIALLVGYLGEDKPYSESEFIAMQVMCLGIMFGSAGLMFIIAIIIAIANCFGKCN